MSVIRYLKTLMDKERRKERSYQYAQQLYDVAFSNLVKTESAEVLENIPSETDPFQYAHKALLWENMEQILSEEAKEVINIILNSPVESKKALQTLLRERGYLWKTIWKTFKELKNFAQEFEL